MAVAAKKIEFEDISIAEIAKRCNLDRTTTRNRLDLLGYKPVHEEAKLKLYRFDDEMKFALLAAKDAFSAAKMRGVLLDNESKELKLAEQRGELVPYAEAVELMQAITLKMYKELCLQMPKRVGPRCKGKSAAESTKIIKAEVEKTFARLREEQEREFGKGN